MGPLFGLCLGEINWEAASRMLKGDVVAFVREDIKLLAGAPFGRLDPAAGEGASLQTPGNFMGDDPGLLLDRFRDGEEAQGENWCLFIGGCARHGSLLVETG